MTNYKLWMIKQEDTCPECGQGPRELPAYEHKSTCRWWRNDETEEYAD